MFVRTGFIAMFLAFTVVASGQQPVDEVRKSIYFGGGSAYIDEEQARQLNEWLDSIPNLLEQYEIHLISHTDPIGGREFNEMLSRMRSAAVQQLLVQRLIPQNRISIKDWGLENPVYNNDTHGGRQMNRRVDVILYPVIF